MLSSIFTCFWFDITLQSDARKVPLGTSVPAQPISRLGKWGDPAADKSIIPFMTEYGRCLGYTHQWDKPQHQDLQPVCMASVDDPVEYSKANDMGWRTFRTKLETDPLLPNEILCPYPKVQCVDCGMCDGKDSKFKKNIVVNVHGVRYKVNRYKGYRTQLEYLSCSTTGCCL